MVVYICECNGYILVTKRDQVHRERCIILVWSCPHPVVLSALASVAILYQICREFFWINECRRFDMILQHGKIMVTDFISNLCKTDFRDIPKRFYMSAKYTPASSH